MTAQARTVKVAVVGTGLAGLTAAYLLGKKCEGNQVNFEVHLFEKASAVGMDSASISLSGQNTSSGDDWRVDVPMRSFQGGYYKNLIALYKRIGVRFRLADFSYSFSSLNFPTKECRNRTITTTMIYNGRSGRDGVSQPSSFANENKQDGFFAGAFRKIRTTGLFFLFTAQLLLCYFLTLFHSLPLWRPSNISTMTFQQWASQSTPQSTLSRWFGLDLAWTDYVHSTLIPLLSAVCTAPEEDIMNHPMEEFLDYIWLTFGTHHYVAVGGVRDVVSRLTAGIQNMHLSSPIISMQNDKSDLQCVSISCSIKGKIEEYTGFHHIVLATQASGALPILSSYLQSLPAHSYQRRNVERQINCLKAFEYRKSIVINHTDESLLPDNSKDVRDLNLISYSQNSNVPFEYPDNLCVSPSYTMATHVLPTPADYPYDSPRVFQTTNPIVAPRKESLLSTSKLDRAIVTNTSKSALKLLCLQDSKKWWQCSYQSKTRLGELQGNAIMHNPSVWICGSYAYLGIPLLEGCVVSARNVVEGILSKENATWDEKPW